MRGIRKYGSVKVTDWRRRYYTAGLLDTAVYRLAVLTVSTLPTGHWSHLFRFVHTSTKICHYRSCLITVHDVKKYRCILVFLWRHSVLRHFLTPHLPTTVVLSRMFEVWTRFSVRTSNVYAYS